jgi:hypothetical protein
MWPTLWPRRRQTPCSRRPARYRPCIQVLEGRCLPSTLTVTTNADSGPGSLRAEIAAAQSGDTIVFAPSVAGTTITLTSGELLINKSLTIQGPETISGGGMTRVFEVDGAGTNVTLSGLTVTNGNGIDAYYNLATDGQGGGILNYGTLTLSGCTLSNNADPGNQGPNFGGAIYNAGTLTVSSCTLSNNQAGLDSEGGGIYNAGSLTVSSSGLYNNSADFGGGIFNDVSGTATLTGCTLKDNSTTYGSGGGIFNNAYATATLTGCSLNGNWAEGYGGGIYNPKHAKLTIQSSNITGNADASGVGADLYNLGSARISKDSTVGVIGP